MRLLAFALAVMATFTSFGINTTDSVKVYFRAGHRQFDPSLGDNREKMDSFLSKVSEAATLDDIECIIVRAYASPDGSSSTNELLARDRCKEISDYIVDHTGLNSRLIRKIPEGIAWERLKTLVENTPGVPSREKVLNILDNTPIWIYNSKGRVIDGRKNQLMSLDRGIPYLWMKEHLFPQLRNAVAVTMMTKGISSSVDLLNEKEEDIKTPGIQEEETDTISSSPCPNVVDATENTDSKENHINPAVNDTEILSYRKLNFALKTNLLFDACLMPNLEFEWLINKKWSVGIEGEVAWWKTSNTRIYRLAVISPEVRFHIRPRSHWHGMYAGLFVGGGLYQLQYGIEGYLGEGGMGGLSFGYMWPIGKHFSFDAGIGVGYMYTQYKVYENRGDHKLYMRTKSLNYVGPLKLKFSIAWRFDIIKKTVKVNSTL
ncbi:MAG: DUF3575 domain-containing protein [Muribaculaceae bacterium]|nr:DUF3575 domain-containing protein [Muribaculaceae bacterium]